MFDLEFYLYGIIPMIIGIAAVFISIGQLFQYRGRLNFIIVIIVILLGCLAEFMLCMMLFFSAWPDFSAHLILLFITLLLFVQLYMNKKIIKIKSI
jgi:hypothetical protein